MGEKFTVEVAADQFDKFARITMPLAGVEQLIWNRLDAEAQKVAVPFELADLGAVELGNSWKKDSKLTKNGERTLHGRDGEGRFRAFRSNEKSNELSGLARTHTDRLDPWPD